ncbi:MAG: hypothetical protein ACFBSG_16070 [Leptolyngbyaceae cyanobacterium]
MKLILSLKGFDASCRGKPSPLFPDGTLYSLPIPEQQRGQQPTRYSDIAWGAQPLGKLVEDLTNQAVHGNDRAHLDPDLRADSRPRPPHWRPAFGQAGAAEGHLRNQGVTTGDIFLFYGWFRAVEQRGDRFQYVRGAPDLHLLFGWLQVDTHLQVEASTPLPAWLREHPHNCNRTLYPQNTLYISRRQLDLDPRLAHLPGAGVFPRRVPMLQLTAPTANSRSQWELPRWFYPADRASTLTYHRQPSRWQLGDRSVWLKNVGQGQEFVLNCDHYPEAVNWLIELFEQAAPSPPGLGRGSTVLGAQKPPESNQ